VPSASSCSPAPPASSRTTRGAAPSCCWTAAGSGLAGELHPRVVAALGPARRTCAAEANLDVLVARRRAAGRCPAPVVSHFPPARSTSRSWSTRRAGRRGRGGAARGRRPLLEALRLFDVYTGPQVGEGKRSLAFALRLRAPTAPSPTPRSSPPATPRSPRRPRTARSCARERPARGRVALVTGRRRGLGRAVALALGAAGCAVAVTGRTAEHLDATVGALAGRGLALPGDATDRSAVEQAVRRTTAELGPVDLLVANAGRFATGGPVWESDPDDWWRDVEVNLRGPLLAFSAVLPGMVERGHGHVGRGRQRLRQPPLPARQRLLRLQGGAVAPGRGGRRRARRHRRRGAGREPWLRRDRDDPRLPARLHRRAPRLRRPGRRPLDPPAAFAVSSCASRRASSTRCPGGSCTSRPTCDRRSPRRPERRAGRLHLTPYDA
jgi:hypothetical protein